MPRDRARPPYRAAHVRRTSQPTGASGERRDPRQVRVGPPPVRADRPSPGRPERRGNGRALAPGPERDPDPPVRARARRSWVERSVIGLGVLVVVLALGGTAVAAWLVRSLSQIDRYDDLSVDGASEGQPENYLVVGSDRRAVNSDGEAGAVGGQRSDTIMIVRLDPATDHADVLSIPRDLWVPIADTDGSARINSAYAEGRQVLLDTLRENFDVEINHYVEIDFAGFRQLVDAIDGVSIYLEDAVRDKASGLYVADRGCVTLDGEQALAFARSRHMQYMTSRGWSRPDPYADLGRIQRQQVFIRRALTKALDEAKSNPLAFKDLVAIGAGSVGIDGDTDPLDLVRQFKDFDTDNLTMYSLPVKDRGDGATVEVDESTAEPILNVFRGRDPEELSPRTIKVRPLNGTAVAGRAAEVSEELSDIGFRTGSPDNIEAHARTSVYHRPGEAKYGLEVARYVEGGAAVSPRDDLNLRPGEVVLAIGADFTGVRDDPTPLDETDTTSGSTPAQSESPAGGSAPAGGSPSAPAGDAPAADASPGEAASDDASAADDSPARPTQIPPPAFDEFTVGDPPPGVDCD